MDKIPYTLYEAAHARADRRFKMMWVLALILVILLVGTNFGWLLYEKQFEEIETTTSTQTITQETAGDGANTFTGDFIGGDYNGETDSNENDN